jgi:hypothetical protein
LELNQWLRWRNHILTLWSANSPFTPALIAIDGNVPHFGLVAGSIGQSLLGGISQNLKLIIFNIFPQV